MGCLFDVYGLPPVLKLMGLFVDVVWYDSNVTPERTQGIPTVMFFFVDVVRGYYIQKGHGGRGTHITLNHPLTLYRIKNH